MCFLGDGEEQEGNVSEAARHATNIDVKNLIVVIDKNGKQLSTATDTTDNGSDLVKIWEGYGWEVVRINGHDTYEIYLAYDFAISMSNHKPVCIIADTIKGNGLCGAEKHYSGYHVYHNNITHNTSNTIDIDSALKKLHQEITDSKISINDLLILKIKLFEKKLFITGVSDTSISKPKPIPHKIKNKNNKSSYDYLEAFLDKYSKQNDHITTYVLTADYPPRNIVYQNGNFALAHSNLTYINVGIREQHLCAMIHGIKTVEPECKNIVLCGDAFMYRCADQLNVLTQSNDHVIFYAVQAGLSGAQNGSTHQSSGITGCLLTMGGVNVYEPATKTDWYWSMNTALMKKNQAVLYSNTQWSGFGFVNNDQVQITIYDYKNRS